MARQDSISIETYPGKKLLVMDSGTIMGPESVYLEFGSHISTQISEQSALELLAFLLKKFERIYKEGRSSL